MSITATVNTFMQIAGYDPIGGSSSLVLPQINYVDGGEFGNVDRLLGAPIRADLVPIYGPDTIEIPDDPSLAQIEEEATNYLESKLVGTWRAELAVRNHHGTPEGWTPTDGDSGYLFEIAQQVDGAWQTIVDHPHTYDGEYGGTSTVQPILSVYWE